jgi:hypothetical protein
VAFGSGGEGAGARDAGERVDGARSVASHRGIRPAPKRRWEVRLSLAEREEISGGLAAGLSLRVIAAGLGRAPSTVSREVLGNGGRRRYRAAAADRAAWSRAARPKATKPATTPTLAALMASKLKEKWSPEQIAGWLKVEFLDDGGCRSRTSRSTGPCSCRPAVACAQGADRAPAHQTRHPPPGRGATGRRARWSPGHPEYLPAAGRGRRPGGARAQGGRPGLRRVHEPVATMVERSTRFAMLVALPDGHHADVVADALAAKITTLPAALTRTVTWDQGHEMAAHTRFTEETGIEVYFCDPSRHGSAAATRTPTDSCASTYPASSTSAP